MEKAALVLTVALLGAAIYFWGRGIRSLRKGDLIAGPAIVLALCVVLFAVSDSSAVFGVIGAVLFLFGVATIVLSSLAKPTGMMQKRSVRAIGLGLTIAGLCLSLVL